nr:Lrp/AsnC family transcriptional regulator [Nanoarchaeota archaeon]
MKGIQPLIEYGEKITLDSKDKLILEQLQLNARQSISKIAKKTKLPRDVVKYRIKKMEKNKVIRMYHAVVNSSKLGYPMYTYILFTLTNFGVEEENKLISYLKQQKNITYVDKMTGKWDLAIAILSKNFKEFDDVLRDIRMKFSHIIKDFDVGTIIQEYKYDYVTDLI